MDGTDSGMRLGRQGVLLRGLAAGALALSLSGCLGAGSGSAPEAKPAAVTDPYAHLRAPGCYTVDLYKEVKVAKASRVPAEIAPFLGEWGNGAWNGKWCHELLIHSVAEDGSVELLDMHGPNARLRQDATIFKRRAEIQPDGSLIFRHGLVVRRYELRDGQLLGTANGQPFGNLEVVLTKKGVVPLPRPRPVMIAKAGPDSAAAAAADAQPASETAPASAPAPSAKPASGVSLF